MSEQRSLDELIAAEAPVAPRRALAITLALVQELIDLAHRLYEVDRFLPSDVHLRRDGSVTFSERVIARSDEVPTTERSECAASVGLVLFELLAARPPVGPADAFEPAVTTAVSPAVSSLIVRSVSDSAAQWPTLDLWLSALTATVGGAATPPPASRTRRERRRKALSLLLLVLLAAITLAVVSLAPRWWSDATRDEGSLGTHTERAMS